VTRVQRASEPDTLKDLLKFIKLNESRISTFFGAVVIIAIGFLLFNFFKNRTVSPTPQITTTQTQQEVQAPPAVEGQVPTSLPETYSVVAGENLWTIAEKQYGSGYNWVDIAEANSLSNPGQIEVGQELKLPQVQAKESTVEPAAADTTTTTATAISGDTYTVVPGDHLWGIADRAYQDGYQWTKIAEANNLVHPDLLFVGLELKLPRGEALGASPTPSQEPTK
jgi:nucleoid-associated protein YgaU